MIHQDWKPVVLSKSLSRSKQPVKKTIITTNINSNKTNIKHEKVYDPYDPYTIPETKTVMIDIEFAKKMVQARLIKKLNQVELANRCMLNVKTIKEYERGGCIRDGSIITKIKKVLGNF